MMHVVDEEEIGLRIVGEIAERDVLPVADEIGEADRLVIEHAQKARRAAAVLNVGLAVLVRRGEKDAGLPGDEIG
jgi:hypothetical protein